MSAAAKQLGKITLKRTLNTPTIDLTRDISTHSWKGNVTLKPGPKTDVVKDTYDFFSQTGLDSLGAEHAVIAYVSYLLVSTALGIMYSLITSSGSGHHPNPNDKVDTFVRATVEAKDAKGNSMEFVGKDGRKYNRVHVPQDRTLWSKYIGYFTRTK